MPGSTEPLDPLHPSPPAATSCTLPRAARLRLRRTRPHGLNTASDGREGQAAPRHGRREEQPAPRRSPAIPCSTPRRTPRTSPMPGLQHDDDQRAQQQVEDELDEHPPVADQPPLGAEPQEEAGAEADQAGHQHRPDHEGRRAPGRRGCAASEVVGEPAGRTRAPRRSRRCRSTPRLRRRGRPATRRRQPRPSASRGSRAAPLGGQRRGSGCRASAQSRPAAGGQHRPGGHRANLRHR